VATRQATHLVVKVYGAEKAVAMSRNALQQQSQPHQMVPVPIQSSVTSSAASVSTPGLQSQSQFPIPKQNVLEGSTATPHPHPQSQEWSPFNPLFSSDGHQTSSQPCTVVPPTNATQMHPPADYSTHEAGASQGPVGRPGRNPDVPNGVAVQPQNLGFTTSSPAVVSTDLGFSASTPGSQQGSAQSILLASEEKSTALYTMRGLAASIKRSLNAERLAASAESPATSDSHKQKRTRSTSAEIIDNRDSKIVKRSDSASPEVCEQVTPLTTETQTVGLVNELDGSPSSMLLSLPQVSPPQQETVPADGFIMANTQHGPTLNFVPFSTLAGAVSFDNITGPAALSHNVHSSGSGPSEDLATSQQIPDILLHGPMDIPLAPISQSSFNPLAFSCRTPTPPLAATITPFHDDEAEKGEESHSSRPAPPPSIDEGDVQVPSIPPASEDIEMSVASGEDLAQTSLNIASLSGYTHEPEALDTNLSVQEADIFVRRTGLLDTSIREISGEAIGSSQAEEHPAGETKSPARTRTASSGSLSKVPVKSRRKQAFYIEVPAPSEWVLRAKRREAEKKALKSEKAGEP
jgi:hypothetical protein